jgi:hypothetical protein
VPRGSTNCATHANCLHQLGNIIALCHDRRKVSSSLMLIDMNSSLTGIASQMPFRSSCEMCGCAASESPCGFCEELPQLRMSRPATAPRCKFDPSYLVTGRSTRPIKSDCHREFRKIVLPSRPQPVVQAAKRRQAVRVGCGKTWTTLNEIVTKPGRYVPAVTRIPARGGYGASVRAA